MRTRRSNKRKVNKSKPHRGTVGYCTSALDACVSPSLSQSFLNISVNVYYSLASSYYLYLYHYDTITTQSLSLYLIQCTAEQLDVDI